jgi:hypothetical protein
MVVGPSLAYKGGSMAKPVRIKVKALKDGWYGAMRHYPEWSESPYAGRVFAVGLDACPHDEEGRLLVREDGTPVLPKWMEVVGALPVIDQKAVECVVAGKEFLKNWKSYARPKAADAVEEVADGEGEDAEPEAPAPKAKRNTRQVI